MQYTCMPVHVYVQDFATSSLRGEVATESEEQVQLGTLEEYAIAERKEWEKRYGVLHVCIYCC